jgi:MFS family permease
MTQPSVSSRHWDENTPGYFGWRVLVGAVIGLALSPGPISLLFFGSLAPRLVQQHGWTFGEIMFDLTILNLASMVAAPFIGQLTDRIGPRWVLLPSIVIMAGCLPLWGYTATTLTQLYAISAIFGVATTGAQSVTYTKLLTSWFFQHRGLALGIAAAGLGLGYTLLPFAMAFGFSHYGPAGTTAMLACLVIVLSLATNAFVARTRDAEPVTGHMAVAEPDGMTLAEAAATTSFWLMAGVILLVSIVATGIVPSFASIGRDIGYTPAGAAAAASIFGFATLAGRLAVGWLFDRFFAPHVACAIFLLAAVGYALAAGVIGLSLSWSWFALATILMGVGFGAESDLIGYLSSRYFGYRHFGAIYGSLLAIFILGVSLGPLLYGVVRDRAGSYSPMFLASAALGVVASLMMLAMPPFSVATVGAEVSAEPVDGAIQREGA